MFEELAQHFMDAFCKHHHPKTGIVIGSALQWFPGKCLDLLHKPGYRPIFV